MTDDSRVPPNARIAVISPHLDDGVLGCADLISAHPGTTVITVFAGRPSAYPALSNWDARAGFGPGDDVVGARRQEDHAALALLRARTLWLNFPDTQYGETPSLAGLSEALERALWETSPEVVVAPLGLFHSDHRLVSDAALQVVQRVPDVTWFVYADAIYRRVPNLLDERLRQLREAGLELEPASLSPRQATVHKRDALACYASQVRALAVSWAGGHTDAYEPEEYWALTAAATLVGADHSGNPAHGR